MTTTTTNDTSDTMFAVQQIAYGILGIGATPAEAIQDARQNGADVPDDLTGTDLRIIPATARLAAAVLARGGDVPTMRVGDVWDLDDEPS